MPQLRQIDIDENQIHHAEVQRFEIRFNVNVKPSTVFADNEKIEWKHDSAPSCKLICID